MKNSDLLENLHKREIAGALAFEIGGGGLPKANVTTRWSAAEIYLHGAQVTGFTKNGEPPLLFLSQHSRFAPGAAIRGGVPICFPWFGKRDGEVSHGFARITDWDLAGATADPSEGATLRFLLPKAAASPPWTGLNAEFNVMVSDRLTMELTVTNTAREDSEFECCLHTYFAVGDIDGVAITGLELAPYIDHVENDAVRPGVSEAIRVGSQLDRTYLDNAGAVEIRDDSFRRAVRIEKSGSASTVIWNPWTTQPLTDLGPEEHRKMICVESGNVGRNKVSLPPGASSVIRVTLTSRGLDPGAPSLL